METFIGEKGLKNSWQKPFEETVECRKCKKEARIMFVGFEGCPGEDEKNLVCNLHETTGEKGGLWVHDAIAIGLYLCPFCFEVTGLMNQA